MINIVFIKESDGYNVSCLRQNDFQFDFLKILNNSDHCIKPQEAGGCPGRSGKPSRSERVTL